MFLALRLLSVCHIVRHLKVLTMPQLRIDTTSVDKLAVCTGFGYASIVQDDDFVAIRYST